LHPIFQNRSLSPFPGKVQGHVGWGYELPGLVEDAPAHCREVRLDDL